MDPKEYLLENIDKIHTTDRGELRIRKNLEITEDAIAHLTRQLKDATVTQQGKNLYVHVGQEVYTIHAHALCVITAHKTKNTPI